MSQRYERVRLDFPHDRPPTASALHFTAFHTNDDSLQVSAHDDDEQASYTEAQIPSSPPPSFRSRASSPQSDRRHVQDNNLPATDADRTLADTFDSPSDDEGSDDGRQDGDDRQRLMRGQPAEAQL